MRTSATKHWRRWRPWGVALLVPAFVLLRPAQANLNLANLTPANLNPADLNHAAIAYKLPSQIEWNR